MKFPFLFSAFTFLLAFNAASQDILLTKKGEELNVKVLEVSSTEVKYLQADTAKSKLLAELFLIKFADGTKKVFDSPNPTIAKPPVAPVTDDSLFARGQREASKYYKGNRGLNTVTLLTTMIFPPVGLATAVSTTLAPPTNRQLKYRDATLFAKPAYAQGYRQKANKIKAAKVWTNFGIGGAILGFAYFSISRYTQVP